MKKDAALILEDGTVLKGVGFGAKGEGSGEIVFNTSMSSYVEPLTDPSYNGQILMSTYPLIGNCNVHPEWFESDRVWVEGFIVREMCEHPSHWKGIKTVDELLREFEVPGIAEVDTRALAIKIRKYGTMKGKLVHYDGVELDIEELLEEVRKQPGISGQDLVSETTRREITHLGENGEFKIVIIDCGVKMSIVRSLLKRKISVIAVPAKTSASQIEALDPDGIIVSNGPGDPAVLSYLHKTVKQLMEKYPMLGVSLGNQILALAAGGKTFKLKFGHRGGNQPVKDLKSGKVYITSQNHSFAIDAESLEGTGFEVINTNCNDGTVEGIGHKELPIFSVEYFPAWDTEHILDDFVKLLKTR